MGVELNKELNSKSEEIEVELSRANSRVKILVLKTDEMEEIVKVTFNLAKK